MLGEAVKFGANEKMRRISGYGKLYICRTTACLAQGLNVSVH